MTDYNPFEERAWTEFERPKQGWLERLLTSIQAVPPSVLVVDLSHYNAEGHCDFAKIKASGVAGVILKCSESDWYKDSAFEYSWQAAMGEDLAVALYHFFRSNKTDEVQFSWFMSCAENFLNYVGGSTAVAADVETVDNTDKDTRAARAFGFCKRARDAGLKDGIYCSPGLVPTLFPLNDSRWNALAWQWAAHWTSAADYTLPNGWNRNLVKAWQFGIYPTYNWCPKVEGAGNAVDVNHMFFETATALKVWLGQDETQPPVAYPFGIETLYNAVIREVADPYGGPLWVAPADTGLIVYEATEDMDGELWYWVGSGWVRASNTGVVDIVAPPVDPPPEPEEDIAVYTVTAEKTLARFVSGYNAAGFPIMMIYPKETAPAEDRVRFDAGDTVQVYPELVRGDGGGDYLEIADPPVDATLYLLSSDGTLS